jgi:hypothetical protein
VLAGIVLAPKRSIRKQPPALADNVRQLRIGFAEYDRVQIGIVAFSDSVYQQSFRLQRPGRAAEKQNFG